MNPRVIRLGLVAGGVVGAAAVAWWGYEAYYAAPAASLREQIEDLQETKDRFEDSLLTENRINRELDAIVASSVHGDRESLEHRVRTACTTLAFAAGLTRLEVNSQPPRTLGNPAATVRGITTRERPFQRTLRDRVDATEVRVTIGGEGSFEAVLTAIALAEAQRWTLGVDKWDIKPVRVAEGQPAVFSLSMTMTALVVDDEGALVGELPIDAIEDRVLAQVGSVVRADPFRTAPPPVVAVAPPPPPPPVAASPPPPPPPAGEGWRLAGLWQGESGRYAVVVHQSGSRRTLALGEEVGGLRLASVVGDVATFEADEERFEVRNGELLATGRGRERR
ncbi:MAG: hypothetical protein NCW75_10890 [Phycisphaera sp.]|nr:MAG: hypothetical protein NCW75_10890 [Phycisphaera sp.]